MDGNDKQQRTDEVFALRRVVVHHLEQSDLDLRLVAERLLVLDDLDRDVLLVDHVEGARHLAEAALADARLDPVAVVEDLADYKGHSTTWLWQFRATFDDIIVVLVVAVLRAGLLLYRSLDPPGALVLVGVLPTLRFL